MGAAGDYRYHQPGPGDLLLLRSLTEVRYPAIVLPAMRDATRMRNTLNIIPGGVVAGTVALFLFEILSAWRRSRRSKRHPATRNRAE